MAARTNPTTASKKAAAGKPAPTTMASKPLGGRKPSAATVALAGEINALLDEAVEAEAKATPAPARKARKATTKAAAPDPTATPKAFATAETDGTYTCRTCAETKDVRSFPTIAGPERRGTQCRACRTAAKAAVAG